MHHELPSAAIVRKFVLGRRFYPGVHPATLSHLLRGCFTQVQYMHLEPWRPVDSANLRAMERGYITLLANLPPSSQHLNIFLESNWIIRGRVYGGFRPDGAPTAHRPNSRLGRQLVQSRGNCILVNVAFLVEAKYFFAEAVRQPAKTWPRLRTLILTSSVLTPTSSPGDIEKLLLLAAAAVARMPHLLEFQLWFTRGQHACAFMTQFGDIKMEATWACGTAANS